MAGIYVRRSDEKGIDISGNIRSRNKERVHFPDILLFLHSSEHICSRVLVQEVRLADYRVFVAFDTVAVNQYPVSWNDVPRLEVHDTADENAEDGDFSRSPRMDGFYVPILLLGAEIANCRSLSRSLTNPTSTIITTAYMIATSSAYLAGVLAAL